MSRKMRFGSSRRQRRDQGGKNPDMDEPHALMEERDKVMALSDSHEPDPLSNDQAELKPSFSENTGLDTVLKKRKLGSTRRHRERLDLSEFGVEAAEKLCEEVSDDTAPSEAQSSELHQPADSVEAGRYTTDMDALPLHGEFPLDLKHSPELRRDDAHTSPSRPAMAHESNIDVEHRESRSTDASIQAGPKPKTSTSENQEIESKLDFEVLAEFHTIESDGVGEVISGEFGLINQLGLNPSLPQEPTVNDLLIKNQIHLIGQGMESNDWKSDKEKLSSTAEETPDDGALGSMHTKMGNESEGIGEGEMEQQQCFGNLGGDSALSESLDMPGVEPEIKMEVIAGVLESPVCIGRPSSSYEYDITTPERLDPSDSTLLGEVTLTENVKSQIPFPKLFQSEDDFSYRVSETCGTSTEVVNPVDHTKVTQPSIVQLQDPNVDIMEDDLDSTEKETTILNPDDNKDGNFAELSEVKWAETHKARDVATDIGLYKVHGNGEEGRASEDFIVGTALQDAGSPCRQIQGVDFTPTQKAGTVHGACASLHTPDKPESESETELTLQSESKVPPFGEIEQSEDVLLTANDSVLLSLSGLIETSKMSGGHDASVPYQLDDIPSSYSNIADRQRDLNPDSETLHQLGGTVESPFSLPILEGHSSIEPGNTSRRRKMGSTRRSLRSRHGEENTEERGEEDATIPKTVGEVEDDGNHTLPQGHVSYLDDKEDCVGQEKKELVEQRGAKDMCQEWEEEPNVKPMALEDLIDSGNNEGHAAGCEDTGKECVYADELKDFLDIGTLHKETSKEDSSSEPFGAKISIIGLPEVHVSGQSFGSNAVDVSQSDDAERILSTESECHGERAHPESNTTVKRRKMGSTRRNQRGRCGEHTEERREEDATIPKTVGEVDHSVITEATLNIEKIGFRDSTEKKIREEEREMEAGSNSISDYKRDKRFEMEELQQPENELSYLDYKKDPSGIEKHIVELEGAKAVFQDWEEEPHTEPVAVEDLSDSRNTVLNIDIAQSFSTSHERTSNEPPPILFSDTVMEDSSSEHFGAKVSYINLPEVDVSGHNFDSNVPDGSQSDNAGMIPVESSPQLLPVGSSECDGESARPESNPTGKRRKMGSTRRNQPGRREDQSNDEIQKEEVTEPDDGQSDTQREEVTDPDGGPCAVQEDEQKDGHSATTDMTCQSLKQDRDGQLLHNTEDVGEKSNMDPNTKTKRRKMGSSRRLGGRRGEQTREERQEEDTGVNDEMKPGAEEEIVLESKTAIEKTEIKMLKPELKLFVELTKNVNEEGEDRVQMSHCPASYDTPSTVNTEKPGLRGVDPISELHRSADTENRSETNDEPNLPSNSSTPEFQEIKDPKPTGARRKMGSTRRTPGVTGERECQEMQVLEDKSDIEDAEKEEQAELTTSMELTGNRAKPVHGKRRMGSSRRHGHIGKHNLGKDGHDPDLSTIGEEHSAEGKHLGKQTEAGGPDESTHTKVVTSPEQLEATPVACVGNTRRPAGQGEKSTVTTVKRAPQGTCINSDAGEIRYSVMMVGNSNVGKTSFFKRFQSGEFSWDLCASVGIDTCTQSLSVDGKPATLHLWDTAGQERYRSITRQVFHRAQAILLMYDITSSQSFIDVRYWLTCIQEGAPEDVVIMLLGNKSDSTKREVETQDGQALAKECDMLFLECSAATGDNVLKSMEVVVRIMRLKAESSGTGSTVLHKEPPVKKSSCC